MSPELSSPVGSVNAAPDTPLEQPIKELVFLLLCVGVVPQVLLLVGVLTEIEELSLVVVDSFYADKFAVTNEQFAEFVEETGYTTDAERFGWSFVFEDFLAAADRDRVMQNVPATPWFQLNAHGRVLFRMTC